MPAAEASASTIAADPERWDDFVASTELGSYLQFAGWATVKAVNGWRSARILADVPGGRMGMQVLVTRPRPLPWGFAYAPHGPVASSWDPAGVAAFTAAVRAQLPRIAGPISHLRIDPEIEADGPHDADGAFRAALRDAGWRPAPAIQPRSTRLVDLRPDEAALWADLRKKWRQYVNKARASGLAMVDAGAERLPEFYAIYQETALRAGFQIRALSAYRDIWEAFAPAGNARLLFAQTPDGRGQATLFLVRCGPRVVEPYGGMTAAGAESRANYLLKWEAIRTSREAGGTSYDMWGEVTEGIAHFKTGFGGRDVEYIGAWDLVLNPFGRRVYALGQDARVRLSRRRMDRERRAAGAVAAEGGPGAAGAVGVTRGDAGAGGPAGVAPDDAGGVAAGPGGRAGDLA